MGGRWDGSDKNTYMHIGNSQTIKKSEHRLNKRILLTENRNLLSSINEKRAISLTVELICV